MKKKYLKLKQATKELRMIQSLKNPKKKSKKVSDYSSDDESMISEDSELFGDSEWNSSIHGGKSQPIKNCSVNNTNMSNVQSTVNKNKDHIKEFNRFDRIIENDNHQVKELENDIHNNELRFGSF